MALTKAEIKATYRARNSEAISAYAKQYYLDHKDEISERVKAYRAANPQKYKDSFAQWYQANKENRSSYQRQWVAKRKERNPALYLIAWAKRRSRELGREFNIEISDITIPETCPLLGVPISAYAEHWDFRLSLDRIDSSKGYIKGNIQVISRRANRLKSDACGDELLTLAINQLKAEGRVP